jgi:DNA polymerase-1
MASLNPDCDNCPLFASNRGTVCLKGDGPKNADIIIVSDAPTPQESRAGKGFQGEPGTILKHVLGQNDLLPYAYLTHAVKCPTPGGRAPSAEEIKACKPYLEQEIKQFDPEYVVSLGVPATKALFRGKAAINKVHGELIEDEKVNYIGMPTFHPAYTLRDPSKKPGFDNDLRRLSERYYGEDNVEDVNWNVVRRGNLSDFIRQFKESSEFAFDCETSGLFQYDGLRYITAIVIALPEIAWVIPGFLHPDCQDRSSSPWRHGKAFQKLMDLIFDLAQGKEAYAWNGKFDNIWLSQMFGQKFFLTFDGMLASHILDENTANDLTTNCRTFLGVQEYDIPLNQKNGRLKRGEKASTNWKYCAEDGAYTLRLVKLFKELLKKDAQVERLFYNLTMPAARALEDIEMRGLTLDRKGLDRLGEELEDRKKQQLKKLKRLVGREVNWNSPKQIAEVFYDELKLKSKIKTPKGLPSTSEAALIDLKDKHPVPALLLKYRETAKFLSTYVEGFKKYMVDEKLFVSYKIHGTVTGRYSSRLHSIPRDGSIRNLVTAPPGWSFVQGDVSQAELRVVASMSGDPELTRCFTENIDVHWRTLIETLRAGDVGDYAEKVIPTAEIILADGGPDHDGGYTGALDLLLDIGHETVIEIDKDWKEARKRAKAVNFGFIYGMFENKFIETAKLKYGWEPTFEEAKFVRDTYFMIYSGVPKWHERQKAIARRDKHVRSLSGRLRRLPAIDSRDRSAKAEAERQAINSPVQGFIGDFKAMAMVEIEETVDHNKFLLVGEHHDAVLGMVRNGYEDEVLPQVLQALRQPKLLKTLKVKLNVPMESDLEIGPWGKGYDFVDNS